MKSWVKSKTIIANSIAIAASVMTLSVSVLTPLATSELVQQYFPKTAAGIVVAISTVNIALRFITSTSIG
jgi:hypothetical protein